MFDSESTLLEEIYKHQGKEVGQTLSHNGLKSVLEEYMIKWMLDASPEDHEVLISYRTLAAEVLPHYQSIMDFAEGRIKTFARDRSSRGTSEAWSARYSFDDAHFMVLRG